MKNFVTDDALNYRWVSDRKNRPVSNQVLLPSLSRVESCISRTMCKQDISEKLRTERKGKGNKQKFTKSLHLYIERICSENFCAR